MAKKEKEKKPIYKRWWVWLIGIIVLIAVFTGGEDDGTDTEALDSQDETTETSDSEEVSAEDEDDSSEEGELPDELLGFGDSATLDDITFTVTGAEYVDERNEFADSDPENVIKIDFVLENGQDDDYPIGIDTQVYVDGVQADSYPLGSDIGSVSAGRTFEGSVYYGVDGEEVELEWEPFFSFGGDKAIWDVTP